MGSRNGRILQIQGSHDGPLIVDYAHGLAAAIGGCCQRHGENVDSESEMIQGGERDRQQLDLASFLFG